MSFSVHDNGDNTMDLRVHGLEEPLASAARDIEGVWTVDPTLTAEHLATFDVHTRRDAAAVLHAIGYAFEAGGGAWQ